MEVKAEFTIRDKDCNGNKIPQKEKERIIKSIARNLHNQWNVSSFSVDIVNERI